VHINKVEILFLQTFDNDPFFNMAMDDYFLNCVESGKFNGVLRFYTWKPASISLGYYQKTSNFNLDLIKNDNIEVVRRISGGNAIFHCNDFTYSLILKKDIYDIGTKKDYYFFIANILKKACENIGFNCTVKEELDILKNDPDCFFSTSQYEIVDSNGAKIIGSAQKMLKNSFLQHGSFFYNYNSSMILKYLNNKDIQIEIEAQKTISLDEIKLSFKNNFLEYFLLKEYFISQEEQKEIENIVNNKYSKKEWNFRK